MAVVFKARHRLLDRVVALKVIRPEQVASRGSVPRFRREVQIAALLSHPNIVLALDADEVGGVHFFVMEYVEGINLSQLVRSKGPLALSWACDYVAQAAEGLAHAHAKGLVHRDIKPSNLMLTRAPGSKSLNLIKILDFGLARLQEPDPNEGTDLTRAGVVLGTPEYLAPEQAANPHTADSRADLYGLGCSFYYLLSGQVPFPGGNALEKLFRHRLEQAQPLTELRGDVPPQLAAVVEKLMAKRPEDRYQSPADLLAALKNLPLADTARPTERISVTAKHPSGTMKRPGRAPATTSASASAAQPVRAWSWPLRTLQRSGRWLAWLSLAVLGLATFAGVVAYYGIVEPPQATDTKPEPPLSTEDAVQQALTRLTAQATNPQADVQLLRQQLVDFRKQFPANPARSRAAELLQGLASPLDALNAQAVPVEFRLDGHPGGDLVLVLGDARLRHGGIAWTVAFSPDGKSVVSGGDDRQVYQWDATNGTRQRVFSGPVAPITALAWSGDGRTIVAGSHDWTARLFDVPSGGERALLRHQGNVRSVAVSRDSKWVATGAHPDPGKPTGPIRLWNMEGKELFRLEGHQGPVLAVAFAPNAPLLASAGEDKTIRLWDLAQRKEVANLGGHQGPVFALAFSPDGQSLASGSADKTLRLWDVGQKKERTAARDLGHAVSGVSFVPKSSLLAASTHEGTLRLFDLGNGQEKAVLRHHGGFTDLAISPDGQSAVTSVFDGAVRLWDLAKQKDIPIHRKVPPVQSLALAPDDRTIATGHQGGKVRLWEASTGKELAVLDKHQHGVPALAFSPDGKALLSGGWDHLAVVWDVEQRKELQQLRGHRGGVIAVSFSPDGNLAGTASHDKSARLWEPWSGKEKAHLQGHTHNLHALTFSPDSKTLATGAGERLIKLWDVGQARERGSLAVHTGEALAYLTDGKTVVSGSAHGAICLWDANNARSAAGQPLSGPNLAWVRSLAVSLDGKNLALAGNDGHLLIWSLSQNKELRHWRLPGMATGLAFSGDSRHLLCALNNGHACVFRLAPPARASIP